MKKYALKITETYTRTVVVEVEDDQDYLAAADKCADAYYDGTIIFNADNSAVDIEMEDETFKKLVSKLLSSDKFKEKI